MFWLAIAIAAIVLAALAVPVQLDVAVEFSDRWRGHMTLRWLYGAVGGREILIGESISCAAASIDGRLTGTALREPVAIVVRSPEGDRAFDLEGRFIRFSFGVRAERLERGLRNLSRALDDVQPPLVALA